MSQQANQKNITQFPMKLIQQSFKKKIFKTESVHLYASGEWYLVGQSFIVAQSRVKSSVTFISTVL